MRSRATDWHPETVRGFAAANGNTLHTWEACDSGWQEAIPADRTAETLDESGISNLSVQAASVYVS
ncbi:hypothetical protein GCM10011507_26530 [Edaphobacter acidisoli]|uniref:Uncharacterized protein n=1 Tax=Edaphobacter acidisoli TaxID=2040573 RepID=A0A916W7C0_9BACT|nr:hypothetical protein GCM10011507_26530 [Edaphobacter acidisoli]